MNELNALEEWKLFNEPYNVRRLIWILEMKKNIMRETRAYRWFNIKRDKQIVILINDGKSIEQIFDKTKEYKCVIQMLD